MVLTDRQRADLHAGIYEYLQSRPGFEKAAEALAEADPDASAKKNEKKSTTTPLLEKKWTAIPRLQKKVLELERTAAQNAKIHAHRAGVTSSSTADGAGQRRMLPRLPCSHTLQGHSAVVAVVEVHPVFTVVVSGSEDGTIKVWDHESGDYVRTMKGHTNTVNSLSFSPSGSYLASCSQDLSIKLWDFSTYACLRTLRGHDHTISALKFIPTMGEKKSSSTTTTSTTGVDAEMAGSTHLLSASRDSTVKVWDIETGFCDTTVSDHTDWVRCLAVRQCNGDCWASSGNDQVIFVYSGQEQSKIAELRGHEHVVESLAFLTEQANSNATTKPTKHMETVRDYLVSGSRDRTVRLWKISGAECLAKFTSHENWVRSVLIHPSGNYIISAGDDRTIRVFDIKANRCLRTLDNAHSHFVTSLAMHYTLPILVSGSVDQTVKCWLLD